MAWKCLTVSVRGLIETGVSRATNSTAPTSHRTFQGVYRRHLMRSPPLSTLEPPPTLPTTSTVRHLGDGQSPSGPLPACLLGIIRLGSSGSDGA